MKSDGGEKNKNEKKCLPENNTWVDLIFSLPKPGMIVLKSVGLNKSSL